jgi:hypothetical protein
MKAQKADNEIKLTDCYLFREGIKEIAGRRYDTEEKAWYIPLSKQNLEQVIMLGAEPEGELIELIKSDRPHNTTVKPIVRMPIRAEPYQHQIAAFNFAIKILMGGQSDG